jgi:hypothetical protein
VRFRSRGKPRGLIQTHDQRRLTLVIVGVGALILLVSVASRPEFWSRIAGNREKLAAPEPVRDISEDLLGGVPLQPDEFTSGTVTGPEEPRSLDLRELLDREEAARLEHLAQGDIRPGEIAGPEPVPAALLKPVRDDIIGVHSSESDAYFASLRLAEKRLSKVTDSDARRGQYALFMDSPETCRGHAWEIRGTLRRMSRLQSDANSFGLKTLYDAWISLPDSGNQLVHVVASSADAGLPLGDTDLKAPPEIQLTGYFFKREGYVRAGEDARGDVGLTPLILAGRIQKFTPVQVTGRGAEELTPYLGWLTLIVCAGVALIIWQFQLSDNVFRRTRTHQLTVPPVRVSFEGVDAVSVSESLKKMQAEASESNQAD